MGDSARGSGEVSSYTLTPVRPELVEGQSSSIQSVAEGGQGFDKLSPNDILV
jgi:hypothetical protein